MPYEQKSTDANIGGIDATSDAYDSMGSQTTTYDHIRETFPKSYQFLTGNKGYINYTQNNYALKNTNSPDNTLGNINGTGRESGLYKKQPQIYGSPMGATLGDPNVGLNPRGTPSDAYTSPLFGQSFPYIGAEFINSGNSVLTYSAGYLDEGGIKDNDCNWCCDDSNDCTNANNVFGGRCGVCTFTNQTNNKFRSKAYGTTVPEAGGGFNPIGWKQDTTIPHHDFNGAYSTIVPFYKPSAPAPGPSP